MKFYLSIRKLTPSYKQKGLVFSTLSLYRWLSIWLPNSSIYEFITQFVDLYGSYTDGLFVLIIACVFGVSKERLAYEFILW